MPVEFLTNEQAAAYGRFVEEPTRPELERFFFLNDVDRDLIALRRTPAHHLGFAVQMCTVRYVGQFLVDDPLDVCRGRSWSTWLREEVMAASALLGELIGPSPKYYHVKRGITWLNAVNDQVAGIGGDGRVRHPARLPAHPGHRG